MNITQQSAPEVLVRIYTLWSKSFVALNKEVGLHVGPMLLRQKIRLGLIEIDFFTSLCIGGERIDNGSRPKRNELKLLNRRSKE